MNSLELLDTALDENDLDASFKAAMAVLCQLLQCDRCFLYIRDPETSKGRITHCYCVDSTYENLIGATWIEEENIAAKDPLMALAFRTSEAVFVEDIEAAGAEIVNLPYEREVFKHRALIHAPIYWNGKLYGIVEPCIFEQPKVWTETDRQIISSLQTRLAPLVFQYLKQQQKFA